MSHFGKWKHSRETLPDCGYGVFLCDFWCRNNFFFLNQENARNVYTHVNPLVYKFI